MPGVLTGLVIWGAMVNPQREKARRLRVGMPRAEVQAIMGEPGTGMYVTTINECFLTDSFPGRSWLNRVVVGNWQRVLGDRGAFQAGSIDVRYDQANRVAGIHFPPE